MGWPVTRKRSAALSDGEHEVAHVLDNAEAEVRGVEEVARR